MKGLQSVYLAEVDRPFAAALYRLIGAEAREVSDVANAVGAADRVSPAREPTLEEWERRVEVDLQEDRTIPEAERQALVLARRGQGQFRAYSADGPQLLYVSAGAHAYSASRAGPRQS